MNTTDIKTICRGKNFRRGFSLAVLSFSTACSSGKIEQDILALKRDISDLRSMQAETTANLGEMQSELRGLNGKYEELQYSSTGKTKELEQTISQLNKRVPPPPGVPDDLLAQDEEKIAPLNGEAADSFKRALSLVRTGDFDGARQVLTTFVASNPGTAFTDNGLFWLGICYYKTGAADRAIVNFSEVFQKYPAEDMVAPALYFLAQSFNQIGSKEDAILTLQKLVDEYGNTAYGNKGRELLASLRPPQPTKPAAVKKKR